MAAWSLLGKDFREHRLAALSLGAGCLLVVLVLLLQNRAAAYSMSSFEIVRFALLSFLPLIALIVGNRLIAREYLSGTRIFVEALPIGQNLPLILKYILGYSYIGLISAALVGLAAQQSGVADDTTVEYVLLILGKTLVMASLYWSIVFCFSLCGYLRIALYFVCAAIVVFLAFYSGIDTNRFAPFALMDNDLFVYERDVVPWKDIVLTLLLSLAFTIAGFTLTRLGEGSVLDRLAKPMTRRDYVALGVLCAAGLTLWSTLLERNQRDPIDFSSRHVLRLTDPDVSVLYIDSQYKEAGDKIAQRISHSLSQLQSTLSLSQLPTVRLILSPSREKHDFDYSTADGVLISANWLEHDSFDDAILDSVIVHGVLSSISRGRSMFEPYHWVLDGFTRWWSEQGTGELIDAHRTELISRALLVLDSHQQPVDLIRDWQLLADRYSYPSAESLAWAAVSYLEESQGREAVLQLADEFLVTPHGSNAVASISDRIRPVEQRVESVVGMDIESFTDEWQSWLKEQRDQADIQSLLAAVPALTGEIITHKDDDGVHSLNAFYHSYSSSFNINSIEVDGDCVLKHDYIGPFDTEFEVSDEYQDIAPCQTETVAHSIASTYAPGDRVFVALDFESRQFHQPIRLHAERVYIP
ncbi:MAG: hypothetical protein KTR32_26420 [Granulosicoccus sp.]|nr:hypothetical protein [Granulosicoccus sp.]